MSKKLDFLKILRDSDISDREIDLLIEAIWDRDPEWLYENNDEIREKLDKIYLTKD